jgi:hypothetical protein
MQPGSRRGIERAYCAVRPELRLLQVIDDDCDQMSAGQPSPHLVCLFVRSLVLTLAKLPARLLSNVDGFLSDLPKRHWDRHLALAGQVLGQLQ